MLCEVAVEVEAASTWAPMNGRGSQLDWQTVDRALRTIAHRRAGLDADEAHWLREAEALQIWRPLGMVSALDYLERVFGYAPRTAQERLRVARALGSLPQLTTALASGGLPFSAVRELTRVATPATEAAWVAAAIGKNLRQIEELVAEHRPGDGPEDPPDPEARTHVVRFELSAETFALLRQTRTVLDDEHGKNLPEDQFVAALCHAVLDGVPMTKPTGRAKFQIAMTVCERCRQGWQDGAGAKIAVGPAAVERAMCDAQHIGSIDGDAPERAYQDIPPSVIRLVWRRDGGRCRIPGCRSARGLEVHHIVHRANGGGHDPSNLLLTCPSCHSAHHAGVLIISGTADQLKVRRPAQPCSVANVDAHMGVRSERSSVATVSARMDARSERGSVATASARMGACNEPRSVAKTSGHSGVCAVPRPLGEASVPTAARNETHPVADVGAHMGPYCVQHPVAKAGAHMGARLELHPVAVVGAHMDARAHTGAGCEPRSLAKTSTHMGARTESISVAKASAHTGSHSEARSVTEVGAHIGARSELRSVVEASAHMGAHSRLDQAVLRTQSKEALIGLGWKPSIATAAVTAASAALGTEMTLERLIFEALRRCPRPTA